MLPSLLLLLLPLPTNSPLRYHPMKTSCYAPSNPPVLDQRLPESGIALDYIHGYTSDSAKSAGALNWLHSGEVIFPAAAVVVLMNHKTNRQVRDRRRRGSYSYNYY